MAISKDGPTEASTRDARVGLFDTEESPKPWYILVRNDARLRHVKDYLNRIWPWFYGNRLNDKDFLSKFHLEFYQRWWELQVAWYLKISGCEITRGKMGPDFECQKNGVRFYVEAVTCGVGDPDRVNAVRPLGNGGFQISERERIELLRFTQAIKEKADKYCIYNKKRVIDGKKPYVIALSPIGLLLQDALILGIEGHHAPAIVKAVYGVGQKVLKIDGKTKEVVAINRKNRPQLKKEMESIPANVFLPDSEQCDEFSGVSGILYSGMNFQLLDYPPSDSELSPKFCFAHNMNAVNAFPKGLLSPYSEWIADVTADGGWCIQNIGEKDVLEGLSYGKQADAKPC